MTEVEIKRADASQKPVVFSLLQIYLHHFAALAPGDPRWRFNGQGQYDYPYFNAYWTDKKRHPYLIYADARLAGFAFINNESATGRKTDFAVAEFFIAGQHAGLGIGRRAAIEIFRHHRGIWELGVVAGNKEGFAFWEKTLQCPEIRDLERLPGTGDWKGGAIFRFAV